MLIELLSNAIAFGIRHLIVRLDSKLIVLHLNNVYAIKNMYLLRMFLMVHHLERQSDYIEYQHTSRNLNTLVDELDNKVLNRHMQH